MAIKIDISQYITRHARGLHANYNALIAEEGIQKDGVIYYCTDTTGAYQGCIIYNGITYGQGNGGVTGISAEQVGNGIKVTLTLKDGTTKDFTIPVATTSTFGLVKTTNSITGNNDDTSLVPTYSLVKALDTNKASLTSPNFSGTPKIGGKEIATKEDVTSAIAANDAMRYKGTLGTGGDFTALPNISDTAVKNGDTYKVVTASRYNGTTTAKVGDMYIANKDTATTGTWDYVPSGDEIETYIQIGTGTAQSGVVKLGTVVTKNIVDSQANATDTDDSLVPTEKRVQGKIDALKTSIDSKVKSVTSNTLNVTNTQQDITVELKDIHTAEENVFGATPGPQSPSFGGTFKLFPVKVDKQGRVIGNGSEVPVTIPGNTATTTAKGLMSATDKGYLDDVVKALKWIDITNS
jgi:hypothetical protein